MNSESRTQDLGVRSQESGFTLIELIMGVTVLVVLATAGMGVFMGSLRGGTQVENVRSLDDRSRRLLAGLTRFLREAKVSSLSGIDRATCWGSGTVTGDLLAVESLDGLTTSLTVNAGILSSVSAQTVELNPEGMTLSYKTDLGYYFTWYCARGVADRVLLEFKATAVGLEGETGVSNDYVLDLVLRNTGQ